MSIGLQRNADSNDSNIPDEIKLYEPEAGNKPLLSGINAEIFDAHTVNKDGLTIDETLKLLFGNERKKIDAVLVYTSTASQVKPVVTGEDYHKSTSAAKMDTMDGAWPTY